MCFGNHRANLTHHHLGLLSDQCRGPTNCKECGRAKLVHGLPTHNDFTAPNNRQSCDCHVLGRNWVAPLLYAPFLLHQSDLRSQRDIAEEIKQRFGVDTSDKNSVARWSMEYSNGANNWIWTYYLLKKIYFTDGPYGPNGPMNQWQQMTGVSGIQLPTRTAKMKEIERGKKMS
jgi:hypothetical protein